LASLPRQSAAATGIRQLDIRERISPVFGGREFGQVGAYELLRGKATCAADPDDPRNAPIALLDRAPRDADGCVSYVVDVCILKPIDAARGNGWLLFEVLNRGNARSVVRINDAPSTNLPVEPGDEGNGFLMRQGYTMAWCAWQGDVPPGAGRLLARLPVVPVRGTAREEFIADAPGTVRDAMMRELDERRFVGQLTWPAAELDPSQATLTARQHERDPRATPPGLGFRHLDDRHVEITRPADTASFDRGTIFEFIYTARESAVMGLGLAAIRDVAGFLRRGEADGAGQSNPLRGHLRHAICFGLSQSGRVIRDFLHHGFNLDAAGRMVFDGVMPVIAGSRKSNALEPFAQPGRYARQHEDHAYGDDQFPFTYPVLTDPRSGRTGGILARLEAAGACAKVMHVDSESEIWSARASLVATDAEGRDVAMPPQVRLYLGSGLPHGSYSLPDPRVVQNPPNTLDYGPLVRALLPAMQAWVEHGTPPPDSRFPSHAAGTWWRIGPARAAFPAIPGVAYPARLNELRFMDRTTEPPLEGEAYPVFVPATDADGNALGGWQHPLLTAARATHTGWNLRRKGFAEGALYSIAGSSIPFAGTRAQREASGDPRPSLEERYGSHAGWKARLAEACDELMRDGLLLAEDRERVLDTAGDDWNDSGTG
jgi:hypothetical protein